MHSSCVDFCYHGYGLLLEWIEKCQVEGGAFLWGVCCTIAIHSTLLPLWGWRSILSAWFGVWRLWSIHLIGCTGCTVVGCTGSYWKAAQTHWREKEELATNLHLCVITVDEWIPSCKLLSHFNQPSACEGCTKLVLRLLYIFLVCLFVCASTLITCAIITSHTLSPCNFTLVNFDGCFEYWCS